MAPTGVMVIDNIEQLDRETIEKLKAMLTSPEVALWYHNVFVMGVDHKEIVDAFSDLNAIHIKDSDINRRSYQPFEYIQSPLIPCCCLNQPYP